MLDEVRLWIPCVTTGWAGLEGWKVDPEITPGSPLGLGGVMLGEVAVAGFEPTMSCCLVDWGNLEQHLGQVGFRQAKGWDTYWERSGKVWWRVAWSYFVIINKNVHAGWIKTLSLFRSLWGCNVIVCFRLCRWYQRVPVWICIINLMMLRPILAVNHPFCIFNSCNGTVWQLAQRRVGSVRGSIGGSKGI